MNVRKNQILFRVTDQELEQININVKKCGLSREAYLRKVSLDITPKELPSMDFLNIIYQLRMLFVSVFIFPMIKITEDEKNTVRLNGAKLQQYEKSILTPKQLKIKFSLKIRQ